MARSLHLSLSLFTTSRLAPCATLSGSSKYCACHTERAATHGDQARRNPFWRLQVLRLPHRQEPRPTATRRAATLSGGSKYCACHRERSRGPRRPGAPQPFLEAPSTAPPFLEAPGTAPATQTGAAAHGDQARRNPFWRLQVLRLPRRQEPRPTATRRAATLSGGSKPALLCSGIADGLRA